MNGSQEQTICHFWLINPSVVPICLNGVALLCTRLFSKPLAVIKFLTR